MAFPQFGESFVGEGVDAAHVNTVLGPRDGPTGTAWSVALATPSTGHVPFVAVVRPGLPVQPPTLFVTKAAITSPGHGQLTWGAAQAGIAAGVCDAVRRGIVDGRAELALIAAVWVNPLAQDEEAVFINNRQAVSTSLELGAAGGPALEAVLAAGNDPTNPFFRIAVPDQ